jgi:citrate lyase subunit beta/citryl-CoA lyase
MSTLERLRSLLFVPADNPDRAARAFDRGADAVIVDLEDGVAPEVKPRARTVAVDLLRDRPGPSVRLLRVNPLDTEWGAADLEAARGLPVDALVLPKATPATIEPWAMLGVPLLVLVETAAALRASYEIASHPAVAALILGGADLSVELRLQPRPDGLELLHARSQLVLDSAAAGIRAPFDVVQFDLHDAAALERECELGKSLGMGGKTCIHPAQLEVVNRVFSPSERELAEAQAVVEAFEAGIRDGRGAVAHAGRMIDAPVVAAARATLARRPPG